MGKGVVPITRLGTPVRGQLAVLYSEVGETQTRHLPQTTGGDILTGEYGDRSTLDTNIGNALSTRRR